MLLTTITTMAGLAPMMFGLSLDFIGGGYTINSPTALWWKQLATAVVFGLGVATVLTLVVTPSLLAIRIWFVTYVMWIARALARLSMGGQQGRRDWALQRAAPDEGREHDLGYRTEITRPHRQRARPRQSGWRGAPGARLGRAAPARARAGRRSPRRHEEIRADRSGAIRRLLAQRSRDSHVAMGRGSAET